MDHSVVGGFAGLGGCDRQILVARVSWTLHMTRITWAFTEWFQSSAALLEWGESEHKWAFVHPTLLMFHAAEEGVPLK